MTYLVHKTCVNCLMKFTQKSGTPGSQVCLRCSQPKKVKKVKK